MNQGLLSFYLDTGGRNGRDPASDGTPARHVVNSAGWAVGTASSAFAIPSLRGTATYRLADLYVRPGWDLSMNHRLRTRLSDGTSSATAFLRPFTLRYVPAVNFRSAACPDFGWPRYPMLF